ncbi:MAG: hypothetical protein GTO67_16490 [Gammaproteobacteria bacterium]|nr:hypothetical protein [Gammaproteobacteria bacterium]NIM74242.1 hypothetical protein [Gammaproteobacteria bacterium]NIN40139.1 hypothetical protein [Gammaproteobacteria bacterium]NIO26023.1 hypothetical protein [Gammaproteobacteria bacterium]NIP65788.1 hypothetical protein [Gammaproteobacteria bacterium]
MSMPPIPDDWRTDWHLAAHVDDLAGGVAIDVTLGGIVIHLTHTDEGPAARSDERAYPVMVVDDEVFVLLSDEPE